MRSRTLAALWNAKLSLGGRVREGGLHSQSDNGGREILSPSTHYQLAASGTARSEIEVSIMKSPNGNRKIKTSGMEFYEGGSRQTLKEMLLPDSIIKITRDWLPPPS